MSDPDGPDRRRELIAIARLRDVAIRLAALEDGGGEAGRWHVASVVLYEVGAEFDISLDEALGLAPQPGAIRCGRSKRGPVAIICWSSSGGALTPESRVSASGRKRLRPGCNGTKPAAPRPRKGRPDGFERGKA